MQSTVRRARPCTTCCCPQLRMPCPCSSTHSITPARTLCISGGTLKKRTALSLKLPPVFRAQVEFEATAPILSGDNATSKLHLRVGAACFAVLEVLPMCAFTRVCAEAAAAGVSRARAPPETTVLSSSCHELNTFTRTGVVVIFSSRERANVGSLVGVVLDARATHVQ